MTAGKDMSSLSPFCPPDRCSPILGLPQEALTQRSLNTDLCVTPHQRQQCKGPQETHQPGIVQIPLLTWEILHTLLKFTEILAKYCLPMS